ncbi:hypothetical protein WA1_24710 [Scytonema hofmannii PCC 7110]|uniref:Uncharacterized protein n=1 Tax=Scytonema hofmannii PCC 7110 TaxID=128403 RepID=A0A139X7Z3_9CYAN|nr:hypothetical protein [Scytonema hofmannii]KYC40827.1 hypothetical protein WA1_24710 [Scytonema hofmannii PCC 7110]
MTWDKLNRTLVVGVALTVSAIVAQSNAMAQNEQQFRFQLFKDQSYCMDVANGRIANGTAIQIAKCKQKGHPAQTWIGGDRLDIPCADAEGGCAYQYRLAANPAYCLDYTYSTSPPKKDGSTLLQLWQCKDAKDGNAAYWGAVLTAQAQAYRLYPRIPNHDVFNVQIAVPFDGIREGTKLRLTEDQNTWRLWVDE